MNLFRLSLRMLRRDWRAGELRILALALIIAVSSITTVSFFADRVQLALSRESNRLLGADLLVISDRPLPAHYAEKAQQYGLKTATMTRFPSMTSKDESNLLAEIRAVSDGYPLRGDLRLADPPDGTFSEQVTYVAPGIPAPGTVWIDEKIIAGLDIKLGEELEVGAVQMMAAAMIAREPDHSVGFVNMGPRLLMNVKDLAATDLIQPGSRVTYQLLVAGDEERVAGFRNWAQAQLVPGQRIEGIRDSRPEIRAALERAEKFLSLAALASVVVAAAAVALAVRRFIQRHLDGCAIMRCLGASQATILRLYSYHLAILGLAASITGCVMGFAAQEFLSRWLSELVNTTLPWPSGMPAVHGLLSGMVLLLGFSLPPLLNLKRVPALRVLRRDIGKTNLHGLAGYAFGLFALSILFVWEAGEFHLGILVMLGFLTAIVVFAFLGWLLIRLLLMIRQQGTSAWRYGLASIRRRTIATVIQAIALGLGLMAMLVLTLIQNDLLKDWRRSLPPNTPNRFLVNIQPDQLQSLAAFFDQHEMDQPEFFPMVRGRLVKINDQSVRVDEYTDLRKKQLLNREFNLSWSEEMQSDNVIVAGRWWQDEEATPENELSLEDEVAKTIGVKLGDRLTFDIAGSPYTATITSLRKVDWDTFQVNFFVVARPGSLEQYPINYVTSFYLPPSHAGIMHELVRSFPNLLIIDVAIVIEQIQQMILQVSNAIEFVFMFTLLAGLIVMYAAISATQDERIYEAAIFRTLGAKRRQLIRAWAAEFAILGTLVGLFASAGATVLAYVIGDYALHVSYTFNPWIWLVGIVVGIIGVTIAGLLGTRSSLSQPPLLTLRRIG
ncbi:putative ABC transport system permease protein [Nitrosomonas nitrosa]|jgi:putative ABC transport system permease protein|uniref:ABC transporter permease n=1 Tax=Nitrosomonas nitrosa TaxID=52442 RepID=UPI000D319A75|nr:FtsX-like permease family protein [Nitrosomonas nitrosa]PTR04835.1 putative ABC transport system permease protein [Nitrosomonas nitrosa]